AALITSATTLIQEGVSLAENAEVSMSTMTDSINNVSRVIGEIAVSSEEQSRGIQQARMAVNEVDRITQQNNQMAEQSTTLVSALQQLTEQLNHEVDLFRLPDPPPAALILMTGRRVTVSPPGIIVHLQLPNPHRNHSVTFPGACSRRRLSVQ
ncbi:hypothetical protein AA215_26085, partial [Salmonella enterica subsp. enterica serovar Newport]|nr:hypothetical protein [Salmonella enterica subsp. enterica serovar Newport]